jgi:hypothetical protein
MEDVVDGSICKALITTVEAQREVINIEKYQWGTWSVQ